LSGLVSIREMTTTSRRSSTYGDTNDQANNHDQSAPDVVHRNAFGERELVVARLYMITVPGLDVKSDWRVVHDRLLDDFRKIDDVLPTTAAETLLIVYRGRAQVDEWLEELSEAVVLRRMRPAVRGSRQPPSYRSIG
jgi:hypothetical protein